MENLELGELMHKVVFSPRTISASDYDPNQELTLNICRPAKNFSDKPFAFLSLDDIHHLANYLLKNFIPLVMEDEDFTYLWNRSMAGHTPEGLNNGIIVLEFEPAHYGAVVDYCFKHKIPYAEEHEPEMGTFTSFAIRLRRD